MITALAVLLSCQLAGEVAARFGGLPVPGPVLGMLLLLTCLVVRGRLASVLPVALRDGTLESVALGLLAHLSLLFVPAGVGVIQRLDVIGANGVAIAVALAGSTLLGLFASAWTFRLLARLGRGRT